MVQDRTEPRTSAETAGSEAGAIWDALHAAIDAHDKHARPRLERYWRYYRNDELQTRPSAHAAWRTPRLAQEAGLPDRITGGSALGDASSSRRREVVIENDIAWRVHAQVDFMFGKPVALRATAPSLDDRRRAAIERLADRIWEASGGVALLQDIALLGHVYGYVDLVVRADDAALRAIGTRLDGQEPDEATLLEAAELVRIEPVEPTRGVPLLDPGDYRRLLAFALTYERDAGPGEPDTDAHRPRGLFARRRETREGAPMPRRGRTRYTELFGPIERVVMQDGRVVARGAHAWAGGAPPIVHIQNVSQPFRYEGLGEVEPLIPLQDELNTRLSDRASRVTMQSFKMYLARGIEGFDRVPVAPGTVWTTDNPDASIETFGGDADSPSEESHLQQIREALDKVSAVPPLASGVVRARLGNLTSANALRITLMGLLSKTARKRVTYGAGIVRATALAMGALDAAGVLAIPPGERGFKIDWADPMPVDLRERAADARAKLDLGVPRERVLRDLGFTPDDPGVQ